MSNNLNPDKKVMAISMLCEGSSIRSIERVTGIHRDTVMRLGVRVGEACKKIMDEKFRNIAFDSSASLPKLSPCAFRREVSPVDQWAYRRNPDVPATSIP